MISKMTWLYLGMASCIISQIQFVLAGSGKFNDWYPEVFPILTPDVIIHYPIDFGPTLAGVIFHSVVTFSYSQITYLYLIKHEKEFEVFGSTAYIYWFVRFTGAMPLSTAYSSHRMFLSAVLVLYMFWSAVFSFPVCLKRRKRMEDENVSESAKFWFDRCVLDAHVSHYVWSGHSVSFWGAISLAFKDGPDTGNNLRGWFSVEDCGTICIMFFAALVMVWIVSDLYLFPDYTKHVKSFYPVMFTTVLTVLANSIYIGKGMNRNSYIYLVLGIMSFFAWLMRGSPSQTKIKNVDKID